MSERDGEHGDYGRSRDLNFAIERHACAPSTCERVCCKRDTTTYSGSDDANARPVTRVDPLALLRTSLARRVARAVCYRTSGNPTSSCPTIPRASLIHERSDCVAPKRAWPRDDAAQQGGRGAGRAHVPV